MESPTMFLNCSTQHNKDGAILKNLIYKLILKINSKSQKLHGGIVNSHQISVASNNNHLFYTHKLVDRLWFCCSQLVLAH